jgi:hypothetical protein
LIKAWFSMTSHGTKSLLHTQLMYPNWVYCLIKIKRLSTVNIMYPDTYQGPVLFFLITVSNGYTLFYGLNMSKYNVLSNYSILHLDNMSKGRNFKIILKPSYTLLTWQGTSSVCDKITKKWTAENGYYLNGNNCYGQHSESKVRSHLSCTLEVPSTMSTHCGDGTDEIISVVFHMTHHRDQLFLQMFHKQATCHLLDARQAERSKN